MIRSQVIKLDATDAQKNFFWRCAGTARRANNWALEQWQKQSAEGKAPSEGDLRKQLNAIKGVEFPWMLEVPKSVIQQSIKNLGASLKNFFDSCKGKRAGPKMGFPRPKSKHRSKPSARLDNGPGTFRFDDKKVKLSKIGWVKTFEELRFDGKPLSATVSFYAGSWWLSVQVELPDSVKTPDPTSSVGIDLGLTTALTLSTGEKISAPKPLKAALENLKRLGRSMSRKVKGSENWKKAVRRLSRLHWRIAQIRKDWQHKATTAIAKRFSVVCVENLNVKGMLANRKLARSISDIGWGEIGRQLKYKCDAVQEVGRYYPSSKTCNTCGNSIDKLPLNVRTWNCPNCGGAHDRDINASLNIRSEGLKLFTASYAGNNACGDGSSGHGRKAVTKLPPMKQESRLSYLGIK
jgi:putative transposase